MAARAKQSQIKRVDGELTSPANSRKATDTGGKASRRKSSAEPADIERDVLRSELEQAKARIAELEKLHEDAVNRIDWVIDSLRHALAELK
ncbi:MAG TPA: hypothetical protein VMX97_17730 [Hyphomicrobiaceae bacterium]|nr:hypothetical protein [Hyphomicrobiaceae bacterium]